MSGIVPWKIKWNLFQMQGIYFKIHVYVACIIIMVHFNTGYKNWKMQTSMQRYAIKLKTMLYLGLKSSKSLTEFSNRFSIMEKSSLNILKEATIDFRCRIDNVLCRSTQMLNWAICTNSCISCLHLTLSPLTKFSYAKFLVCFYFKVFIL